MTLWHFRHLLGGLLPLGTAGDGAGSTEGDRLTVVWVVVLGGGLVRGGGAFFFLLPLPNPNILEIVKGFAALQISILFDKFLTVYDIFDMNIYLSFDHCIVHNDNNNNKINHINYVLLKSFHNRFHNNS